RYLVYVPVAEVRHHLGYHFVAVELFESRNHSCFLTPKTSALSLRNRLRDGRITLLAEADLLVLVVDAKSHAGRMITRRAPEHNVRCVQRGFFFNDSRLLRSLNRLLMPLDDVDAFDDQTILARHILTNPTARSLVLSGDDDDVVTGHNLLCHFSSVPWS